MRNNVEMLVLITIAFLSLMALVFSSALIKQQQMLFGQPSISPDQFPNLTLTAMLIMAIVLLVKPLKKRWFDGKSNEEAPLDVDPDIEEEDEGEQSYLRLGAYFLSMIVYAIFLKEFGFVTCSAILVAFVSVLLGARNVLEIVSLSLISPFLLYVVSTRGLKVALPETDLIERAVQALFQFLGLA